MNLFLGNFEFHRVSKIKLDNKIFVGKSMYLLGDKKSIWGEMWRKHFFNKAFVLEIKPFLWFKSLSLPQGKLQKVRKQTCSCYVIQNNI